MKNCTTVPKCFEILPNFDTQKWTATPLNPKFIEMIELWGREEYEVAEDHINFYIPVVFDIAEAFGVELDADTGDYLNVYADWYFDTNDVELVLNFVYDKGDCDSFDVVLTDEQKIHLLERLNEESEVAYEYNLTGLLENFRKENA